MPSTFAGTDNTGMSLFHNAKNLPAKEHVAMEMNKDKGSKNQPPGGGSGAVEASGEGEAEGGIAAKRLPRFQKLRKEMEQLDAKVDEIIINAYEIVNNRLLGSDDEDYRCIIDQGLRCLLALTCREVQITQADGGEVKVTVVPKAIPNDADKFKNILEYNETLWAEVLEAIPLEQRPQCKYSKLMPWHKVLGIQLEVKSAQNTTQIAEHEKVCADFRNELGTFNKNLKKSITALENAVKHRKSEATIETSKRAADAKKADQARKAEEALSARLRRQNVLTPAGLKVKWISVRSQATARMVEVESSVVTTGSDLSFVAPWLCNNCVELTALLNSGTIKACINRFAEKHGEAATMAVGRAGVVFAEVPARVDMDGVKQILSQCVPQKLQFASLLPEHAKLDNVWMCGRRTDKAFSTHTTSFLGQYLIVAGSMTVDLWCVEFRPLYRALCNSLRKPKLTVKEFNDQASELSTELADLLQGQGCTLFSALCVPRNGLVWIPPGYHVWLQSGGGDSSTKLVTLSMAVATMELCGGKTSSVASMTEYCNMFLGDPATNKDPVLKQEIALAAAALKAFKSPTVSDHIRPIFVI